MVAWRKTFAHIADPYIHCFLEYDVRSREMKRLVIFMHDRTHLAIFTSVIALCLEVLRQRLIARSVNRPFSSIWLLYFGWSVESIMIAATTYDPMALYHPVSWWWPTKKPGWKSVQEALQHDGSFACAEDARSLCRLMVPEHVCHT